MQLAGNLWLDLGGAGSYGLALRTLPVSVGQPNQIKFCIEPSYTFVAEPQTNGVARFAR